MDLGAGEAIGLVMTLLVTVGTVVFTLVITVVSIALPLGIMFVIFRAMAKSAAAERELLATGLAAPARIVSVGETGMYINHQPQVKIVLEVAPPEGESFTASVNKVVSILQIPQVQPGTLVEVRYDPKNPSRIAIVGL